MSNTLHKILSIPLAIIMLTSFHFRAEAVNPTPAQLSADYPWQMSLLDSNGDEFQLSDYRGQTLLLSFFYATCGYACPIQTARLAQVQKLLEPEAVRASKFVSVSIHPERDTPRLIDAFKKPYDINPQHWQFGTPVNQSALEKLLIKAGVNTRAMQDPDHTDHTMKILLIDPAGLVMQRYVGDKFDIQRVATEVATVVRLRTNS